jgi:hypothetical protein
MGKTKVKRDKKGLYVRCDGWIGRAPGRTKFKEGDVVKASHPAGPNVWVKPVDDKDRSWDNPKLESWWTEDLYWWHGIEGRGPFARKLREYDIARYKPPLDYYKNKQWVEEKPLKSP